MDETPPAEWLAAVTDRLVGLNDESALASRRAFVNAATAGLTEAGNAARVGAWMVDDDSLLGVALAAQIGGELGGGITELLDAERFYAAATLGRQLAEVEYLLRVFAQDNSESAEWVNAGRGKLQRDFMPGGLRDRIAGGFRYSEYKAHSDLGGHPNPRARFLLPNHGTPSGFHHEMLRTDAAQHLAPAWRAFLDALALRDASNVVSPDLAQRVRDAEANWRETDPSADRLPLPPNSD